MSARDELLALVLCGCDCKGECSCLGILDAAIAEAVQETADSLDKRWRAELEADVAERDRQWVEALDDAVSAWYFSGSQKQLMKGLSELRRRMVPSGGGE